MRGALGSLVRKEFTELRRDRRVLVLTLVLPVVLYPLVIGGMNRMQEREAAAAEAMTYRVAFSGENRPIETALLGVEGVEWMRVPSDSLESFVESRRASLGLRLPQVDAVPDTVVLVGRMTRTGAQVASERIRETLEDARWDRAQEIYEIRGGPGRLDRIVGLRSVDVSTARESGGAEAGRMLVYLLLMTLFMAASTLGIDMIAGEKERGTLETLFLAPLERSVLARSKLIVAGSGALITGLLSLASLSVSYASGWLGEAGTAALDPVALGLVSLLMLPLSVLLAAVLLVVSAWSRSLKEAQYYVLPLLFLVFVPAFLSMSQSIEARGAVAVVPVANVAFVMRDVLAGRVEPGVIGLVLSSTLLWIVLAARQVGVLMEREETVLGFDPEPFFAATEGGRRRAIQVAMALTVVGYFYVGQWLQARSVVWGLAISLWLLLPGLGWVTQRLVRDRVGRWRELVSLRMPPATGLLAGVLLGVGMLLPMVALQELQAKFLPMPTSQIEIFVRTFEQMATWQLFVLAALSPAICEEFVFRGLFLGHLRRQGSDRRAVLWTAFWFALIHLSVFRFAPTFLLGVVLAVVVVRTGSLLPAVVLHLLYNGSLLLGDRWLRGAEPPFALDGPIAWGLTVVLLGAGVGLLRLRPARSSLP